MTIDDVLSEEDMAELDGITAESAIPEEPPALMSHSPEHIQATPEECKRFIKVVLEDFPGLISDRQSNWMLAMIEILDVISYRADRSICANPDKLRSGSLGHMTLATHCISPAVLVDILVAITSYAASSPDALTMDGVEGAILINTADGGLAYQASEVIIEDSASKDKEGWASW